MARNRGKKALYEVMSKTRIKPGTGKTIEQLHPKKNEQEVQQNKDEKPVVDKPQAATQWWKKPRMLQFNAGRIEFSLPYQIAIAIVLGLIALALIIFGLGQYSMSNQETARSVEGTTNNARMNPTGQANINRTQRNNAAENRPPHSTSSGQAARQAPAAAQSTGNNVIVLKEYGAKMALVLAQQYFEKNDIMTEVVLENGRYFLQTTNTYDNPMNPGTNGYIAKMRIIKVGNGYKAPTGFETFNFKDAYGKKVK